NEMLNKIQKEYSGEFLASWSLTLKKLTKINFQGNNFEIDVHRLGMPKHATWVISKKFATLPPIEPYQNHSNIVTKITLFLENPVEKKWFIKTGAGTFKYSETFRFYEGKDPGFSGTKGALKELGDRISSFVSEPKEQIVLIAENPEQEKKAKNSLAFKLIKKMSDQGFCSIRIKDDKIEYYMGGLVDDYETIMQLFKDLVKIAKNPA
ncbi:MAG: hypothetical protein JW772_02550, partial [Candidatus Diapherotrites archaeon]|nr:hypothetical protein [Candidatus Diapherotrites archaeon]